MRCLHIRFYGERALFRNFSMPGADVATSNVREEAIIGLFGNILGKWRNFNDATDLSLTSELKDWVKKHKVTITSTDYFSPEIRLLGQHRYKSIKEFTKERESGPKTLSYHWNVQINIVVLLDEEGSQELIFYLKHPIGTPYLGQSNCLAQIELLSEEAI